MVTSAQVFSIVIGMTRPNHSSSVLLLSFVDIAASLAKIEISFSLSVYTLDLQQSSVLMLIAKSSFKSSENCFHVQPETYTSRFIYSHL